MWSNSTINIFYIQHDRNQSWHISRLQRKQTQIIKLNTLSQLFDQPNMSTKWPTRITQFDSSNDDSYSSNTWQSHKATQLNTHSFILSTQHVYQVAYEVDNIWWLEWLLIFANYIGLSWAL